VEQQLYHAGELVRGYVDVRIKEEMPLLSCSAILSGTAHTRVRYTQSDGKTSHTRTAKEAHRVLCLQAPVTNFSGGVVRPGHTQYPFEFTLPANAVTSVAVFKPGGGHSCFLAYTIAVAITAPGRKQTVVHEVPLDVVAAVPPMKAAQRSEIVELNTCFCIPSGRVDLVAQASKNAYEGGETPAVDYGIRNESSRALSAVKIKIKRQVWFKARGHQKKFKNTIVKREFDGVEAGGVFGFDGLPMRRGELPLPAVVRGPRGFQLFSIDSPTIKVRYWLKIEATTTAECVRSARLRLMDVQIYRTAPWRATAVFAGTERDDDDDDDGLAWGEVISYEPSPDLGDVPVAVPIPSAPPVEAVRA
jgi:hypothetical protein